MSEKDREECQRMGNSERECANWVRLIFMRSNGQLFVCSSNGMKPQVSLLDGGTLKDVELPRTIIGICSPHETLNTTAVYVGEFLCFFSYIFLNLNQKKILKSQNMRHVFQNASFFIFNISPKK